jgi:hypothetical protein
VDLGREQALAHAHAAQHREHELVALEQGPRHDLLVPDVHQSWIEGTREAMDHLDDTARAAVAQLLREALVMVEEAMSPARSDRSARAS